MVTHSGHNLGHQSLVHRSKDPIAGIPGPAITHHWILHDQLQCLQGKYSSRRLPSWRPKRPGSEYVHESKVLFLCPGFLQGRAPSMSILQHPAVDLALCALLTPAIPSVASLLLSLLFAPLFSCNPPPSIALVFLFPGHQPLQKDILKSKV